MCKVERLWVQAGFVVCGIDTKVEGGDPVGNCNVVLQVKKGWSDVFQTCFRMVWGKMPRPSLGLHYEL